MSPSPKLPYCKHCESDDPHTGSAVTVSRISARYPDQPSDALSDVSFDIQPNERIALVGPNGSGKSTLLKCLSGLHQPHSGSINIFGHPVEDCLHEVTYLPQRSEIDWRFPITVLKLVLTGSYIHLGWFKRPSQEHIDTAHNALKTVGLESFSDRLISELSVGQQQRILIARALVHSADILLLDEPLNAVDAPTRSSLIDTLNSLHELGKTLLISTHDEPFIREHFDRTLRLESGKLTQ